MTIDEAKEIVGEERSRHQRIIFYDQMAKNGKSLFMAVAQDLDNIEKRIYWAKPTELLARASEPYFMETGNPTVALPDSGSATLPHGPEREQTNKAFREFMGAFAQHMHARYPAQPTADPSLERSRMSEMLFSRRARQQALDETQKPAHLGHGSAIRV